MKKYLRLTVLPALLAAILFSQLASATVPVPTRPGELLTIRVDSEGRYWWLQGRVSMENLPSLIRNVSTENDSAAYFPNYDSLRTIISDHAASHRAAYLLIVVHPESHYMHFGNLYALLVGLYEDDAEEFAWADREWEAIMDSLRNVYTRHQSQQEERTRLVQRRNELRQLSRFRLKNCVTRWEERDDRIMKATWEQTGVASATAPDHPAELTFGAHWEAGEWDELIRQYADPECGYGWYVPNVAAPKVGIPEPVVEDEIVED